MGLLTREAILAAQDVPREEVPVPEWGGAVLVRGLTAKERGDLAFRYLDANGQIKAEKAIELQILIPALCLIDETGARLFSEADIEALGQKSSAALNRVFEVAQRLSALSAAAVGEMTKNSGNGQSEDSPFAWP